MDKQFSTKSGVPGQGEILTALVANMVIKYIDGLVQDCSNSIANALELLQSCTKPLIYNVHMLIIIQIPMKILLFSKTYNYTHLNSLRPSDGSILADGTKPPMMIFH